MARRRNAGDSSLELLLDTICNTFGGVLFLAMLVSLMLTQTRRKTDASPSDAVPAVSAAQLSRLETKMSEAVSVVEMLEAQASQARRASADFAVANARDMLAELESAERQADQAEVRRSSLLVRVAAEQASTAQASAAKAAAERDSQRQAADAQHARTRLAELVKERESLMASAKRIRENAVRDNTINTTGNAPRTRLPDKSQFPLMVRYGRLYLMKKLQAGRLVVNEDQFVLTPGMLLNKAAAKPHAGIDLANKDGRDEAMRLVMADFPPSRWYAVLVVHPDSFEEYITVKNWLVDRGYNFMPLPTRSTVSDTGSSADQRMQ